MAKKKTVEAVTHSKNFGKVKRYYDNGFWNKQMVYDMVTHPENAPWITTAEYEEITGEPYEA